MPSAANLRQDGLAFLASSRQGEVNEAERTRSWPNRPGVPETPERLSKEPTTHRHASTRLPANGRYTPGLASRGAGSCVHGLHDRGDHLAEGE